MSRFTLRYRARHPSANVSGASDVSQAPQGQANQHQQEQQIKDLTAELEGLRDELLRRRADNDDPSAVARLREEVDRLREEAAAARAHGARRALDKAGSAYARAAKEYELSVAATLDLCQRRLGELVGFLQRLLSMESDGTLDFSSMSTSMREALQKSMDEGRRLSQSLLGHSFRMSLANETQNPSEIGLSETQAAEDMLLPAFELPKIDLSFVDAAGGHFNDNKDLIAELKDNVNQRIAAQHEAEKLKAELKKLNDKLREKSEYHEFTKPLMRSRSNSRSRHSQSRAGRSKRDTSDVKTIPEPHDSDAWSQPDKAESRRRLGIDSSGGSGSSSSKIPVPKQRHQQGNTSSEDHDADMEAARVRAEVLQLRSRLAAQEDLFRKGLEEERVRAEKEMADIKTSFEKESALAAALKAEKVQLTEAVREIKDRLETNVAAVMRKNERVSEENKAVAARAEKLAAAVEEKEKQMEEITKLKS